ncbi:hexokinase [Syncephalis pseudoplumigaleata]|uniref:Phosphotransferase n=1 Tax=Syncephalis pseudoplumigaleata TaxID=1712513 RepID=A0A4P9Z2A9_9FUNG|nr:hexokinase [Syncephalis pseudoplumigaleata]|eukprot:RKP26495.1 hexokinase [Syncephalis pseudoplumigaleata]
MPISCDTRPFEATALAASLLSEKQRAHLDQIAQAFTVDDAQLDGIFAAMSAAMNDGLAAYGSTIAMIPTHVVGRISGQETGTYLALDLGGTHLRICAVHLRGGGEIDMSSRKFTVPDTHKINATGRPLFDYMAECIRQFVEQEASLPALSPGQAYSLGFTFSYPVHQTAVDRGTLLTWTKGFNLPDVVGRDVAQLLQAALARYGLPVKVAALTNDTVACLLAQAYRNPTAQVGLIVGTGNNAAYYEKIGSIGKLHEPNNPQEMIINTEWGAFDTERRVLPRTMFDARIDRLSPHPFKQQFEKMIGGQYLGELLRQVILDFIDRRLLFDGKSSGDFNQELTLHTEYLALMEADTTPERTQVQNVLEAIMGLPAGKTTLGERMLVQRLCQLISTRSARLCATALAALVSKRPDKLDSLEQLSIGVDGSLFERYPRYADHMAAVLHHHLKLSHKVSLSLIKDGSVIGAALATLLAEKHRQ